MISFLKVYAAVCDLDQVLVTFNEHEFLEPLITKTATLLAEGLPGNGEESLHWGRAGRHSQVAPGKLGEGGVLLLMFPPELQWVRVLIHDRGCKV